jgi:hypothetical protein
VRARVNGFRFLELVPSPGRFIVSFHSDTEFEHVKYSLSLVLGDPIRIFRVTPPPPPQWAKNMKGAYKKEKQELLRKVDEFMN